MLSATLKKNFPILIVEDNGVSSRLLERMLLKAGYEVKTVENGRQGLSSLREQFFPIVLTDWMMPEMDGLELCRAIRKEHFEGYVFVILLTAKDSKDDIVKGLEAGADDYLTKPVNHAELLARINTGIRILELERSLKKANDEIRMLSITDPLTGIYNRCFMAERLPQEIMRALRYRRPFSLILTDIDHFKTVNDTYGHQTGDHVLKEFVQYIRGMLRENVDWVVRYGGEEFLIVLPETDFQGACQVAERLREAISRKIISFRGETIHITCSFGVTGVSISESDPCISAESLIDLADEWLYKAKRNGRNCVEAGAFGIAMKRK